MFWSKKIPTCHTCACYVDPERVARVTYQLDLTITSDVTYNGTWTYCQGCKPPYDIVRGKVNGLRRYYRFGPKEQEVTVNGTLVKAK